MSQLRKPSSAASQLAKARKINNLRDEHADESIRLLILSDLRRLGRTGRFPQLAAIERRFTP